MPPFYTHSRSATYCPTCSLEPYMSAGGCLSACRPQKTRGCIAVARDTASS